MHRPLRVPYYLRVWNLIKGILFYNTWNWEKASDGLKMPSLSREERERSRPKADIEIIKPREKPRARLEVRRKKVVADRYQAQVSEPLPETFAASQVSEPVLEDEADHEMSAPESESTHLQKRRRYKRRRTSSKAGGDGFFRRVFGR